jgi:hypothetical protein
MYSAAHDAKYVVSIWPTASLDGSFSFASHRSIDRDMDDIALLLLAGARETMAQLTGSTRRSVELEH